MEAPTRMRVRRLLLGLSQVEVAAAAGVSQIEVSQCERGIANKALPKIAAALGMAGATPTYLHERGFVESEGAEPATSEQLRSAMKVALQLVQEDDAKGQG
jgi:transcriptional regulator with XRE-family HTH domain